MELTVLGYIFIPYLIFLCFKKVDFVFYNVLFLAPFTTMALIDIGKGSSSILISQIMVLLLLVKVVIGIATGSIKFKLSVSIPLLIFVVYCGISLIFLEYNTDIIVYTPNTEYDYVKFSTQNLTQYLYIVYVFILYLISSILFNNKIISMKKMLKVTIVAYVIMLFLGFIQQYMDMETFNYFFRNAAHANNQLNNIDGVRLIRISSATQEASNLSLYIVPLLSMFLYKFTVKARFFDLFLFAIGTYIAFASKTSSIYLVLVLVFVIYIILWIKDINSPISKKVLLTRIAIVCLAALVVLVLFDDISDLLVNGFDRVESKISGEGVSGSKRMEILTHNLSVFKQSNFMGVGYGASFSPDLFSSLLANVGIIGFGALFIFIMHMIIQLFRIKSLEAEMALILNLSTAFILYVSCGAITFPYVWINFALGYNIIKEHKEKKTLKKEEVETNEPA